MNSMPAASNVERNNCKFAFVVAGTPSTDSARVIVLVLTSDRSASFLTDHWRACRAILICTPVSIDKNLI